MPTKLATRQPYIPEYAHLINTQYKITHNTPMNEPFVLVYCFYISAFGMICAYTATATILPFYFNKYLHLAFAIEALGFYIGMAVLPNVLQYLLDIYGYGTAMGIFAFLHVIHIIAGFLYFEPVSPDKSATVTSSSGKIAKPKHHKRPVTQCICQINPIF